MTIVFNGGYKFKHIVKIVLFFSNEYDFRYKFVMEILLFLKTYWKNYKIVPETLQNIKLMNLEKNIHKQN